MTIPPACCAVAEHAKPRKEFCRIGRADRGGPVLAGAGAIGIRAGNKDDQLQSVAQPLSFIHTDKLPEHDGVRRRRGALYRGSGKLDAYSNPNACCYFNPDADTLANTYAKPESDPNPDRRGLQREFDQ